MDPLVLDAGTAERLVRGALDAGDAPPEYRAVARTVHALRADADDVGRAGESVAVERIAAVVFLYRRPRLTRRARRARRSSVRAVRFAAAAVVVGAVSVTGGFAAAGSLPKPAQNAAHAVLGTVGISVPSGGEEPAGVEEPATTTPLTPAATNPNPLELGAPSPGTGISASTPSSPAAPGNGNGVSAHGTPPSNAKGRGDDHTRNGSPGAGLGNGSGR
jgi:hypothetical protein